MNRLVIIVCALLGMMNAEPLPGATVKILRLLPFTGVDSVRIEAAVQSDGDVQGFSGE